MSLPRVRIHPAALFALFLGLAACDGDGTPSAPPSGAAPSSLRVLAGDGQQGVAGAALPEELAVGAVDAGGNALPGMAVQFVVVSGGGRVTPQTATSDARGLARVRWTLGTVAADSQVLEARREGLPPVRLRATVRPDAPAALAIAAGNGASAAVGSALDSLSITVRDRYGNPVLGLPVTWEVGAGGGSVSPARTATGAGGVSKAQWTLGLRVDSAQTVVVRVAGLDSVVFTAHAATAGVPLQLAKRGGDGQRGPAGSVLLDSLGVVLRMADGRPVQGAVVFWSAPASAGTVTPAVSRTDANGVASAVWRLGTLAGLAQVTATVNEGTLIFTSLIQPAGPTAITAEAGGGEGPVAAVLEDSLEARVRDAHGNPVPGVQVEWAAVTGGGAVAPATSTTDARGIARTQWTLGPTAGAPGQTVAARLGGLPPATFQATALTRGVPLALARTGGDRQTGPVGDALADSLTVQLRTPSGQPVQGATVVWNVTSGGGQTSPTTSRTDAQGRARAAWTLGPRVGPGGASARVDEGVLAFTATARPGAPSTVQVWDGDGQSTLRGMPVPKPLVARVFDRYGNAVPGALVRWSVLTGGGRVQHDTARTDSIGVTWTSWATGIVPGENTAGVSADGAASARFTATGTTGRMQLFMRGLPATSERINRFTYRIGGETEAFVSDGGSSNVVTPNIQWHIQAPGTIQPLPLRGFWADRWIQARWSAVVDRRQPIRIAVSAAFEDQRVTQVVDSLMFLETFAVAFRPTVVGPYRMSSTVEVLVVMPDYGAPGEYMTGVRILLSDDNGWTGEVRSGETFTWPTGTRTGLRTIRACVGGRETYCNAWQGRVIP